jgi:hypothetical protein
MREVDLYLRDASRRLIEYRSSLAHTMALIERSHQQINEVQGLVAEVDQRLYGRTRRPVP